MPRSFYAIKNLCKDDTETFGDGFQLRLIDESIAKLLAYFAFHLVQSEKIIYAIDLAFNFHFLMIFSFWFLSVDFKTTFWWIIDLKRNLKGSKDWCKIISTIIASESGFDFSSHILSILLSPKTISKVLRLKIVSVRSHLFKAIADNINASFGSICLLSAVIDFLFVHSECLESTYRIIGKIFSLLFFFLIWTRVVWESIMGLNWLLNRLALGGFWVLGACFYYHCFDFKD